MPHMTPLGQRQELIAGLRAASPLLVAMVPIGAVFGAIAVSKGLSPLEASLMSLLVFAGGAQFVAMDLWTHPASWTALGLTALLVNLRHILMSASIGAKMGRFRPWQRWLAMPVLTDESWALAEFRSATRTLYPAFFTASALSIYAVWNLATLAGALLGSIWGDTTAIGLDFAFTAVFIVLLMGFWRGRATGFVLLASAAVAFLTDRYVPGAWYIATGALAGLAVATFVEDEQENPA